jgi:hypothetical protein
MQLRSGKHQSRPGKSKGTNLVVTSMAKRIPVSLRKTARIEGRATLGTTKTRLVPRLANGLNLYPDGP